MTKIPTFENRKDLFEYLFKNKNLIIAEKKSEFKKCDEIDYLPELSSVKITKNESKQDTDDVIYRRLIINTTNYMDSHDDAHFPGIWNKSLNENNDRFLLQEHEMRFANLIAPHELINAYVQTFNWKELGYNVNGTTQALVYEAEIQKKNNPFMFDKYVNNQVKNHSVGMRYVKMLLAVNDEDYKEAYAVWQEYYPLLINKERAEKNGHFYPVLEAKEIEGSAVMKGSNPITPTLNIKNENNFETTNNALIERLKIYEPNFSLENLNDNKQQEKSDEKRKIYLFY